MGLIDLASNNSLWRGLNYYKDKKVISYSKINESQYTGIVEGNYENNYNVLIDTEHPKKSTCNCPHAEGTRRVCKHKVALYFTVFPSEVDKLYQTIDEEEEEYEQYEEEMHERVLEYIYSRSKEELQQDFIKLLVDDPEWL